jgi:Tfp pilus assembly protein PilN
VIPARIGLSSEDGRLCVVALTGRDRLEHFVVEGVEDPASALAAELHARGLLARRIRIGLDRKLVMVKTLELPRVVVGGLGQMVGFELERHVPFPPEEARFDWAELASGADDQSRRVLIAACERRIVERPLSLLAAARRRPASLTVACHDLPELLPRALPSQRTVWIHRHGRNIDLLFLDGRAPLMSRRVTAEDAETLAREIQRSLPLVGWRDYQAVWLSGDDAEAWLTAFGAVDLLGAPLSPPPYAKPSATLVGALPPESRGTALLALAVATGSRPPRLDLLPGDLRPWRLSRAQLVTAGMVIVTVLLGLAVAFTHVHKTERYLEGLTTEIRRLDSDAKAVDGLAAELARKRSLLHALQSVKAARIEPLPVLRELTETLPASVWLQALSMGKDGVELTGQADSASQLIPLLETAQWLERAEFTSPVTKTQSKDQFRIRAAWKTPSAAPSPKVR